MADKVGAIRVASDSPIDRWRTGLSALYNDEKLKQCHQRNEREEKLPRAEASLLLSSSYVRRQWIVLLERYLHRLCLPQAAHRGYIEDRRYI